MSCIAAHLRDCGGGTSAEHYISRSVLKLAGKAVRVSGFAWQQPGQATDIGIGSLTSKRLCRHHNEQLSPLDEEGRRFLEPLKRTHDEASGEADFSNETFLVDGDRLELWLLKVLCGILTASRAYPIPNEWIEILFQRRPFPEGAGLHIFGDPGPAAWYFNLLRVISVRGNRGEVAGAKFGIGGLALLLAFGTPRFHESGVESIYRPARLQIHKGPNTKELLISWGRYQGAGSVSLRIEGAISLDHPGPRSIVRPNTL